MDKAKTLFFLYYIFVVPFASFGQYFVKGSTEAEFVNYFKSRKGHLKTIEGIWMAKTTIIDHQEYPKADESAREDPATDEVEMAIIENDDTQEIFTYSIIGGVCKVANSVVIKFTASAIPNRYFFSSDMTSVKCDEITPISFLVKNNAFSFSCSHLCHSGDGITYQTTGRVWRMIIKEEWSRIYPSEE